MIIRILLSLLIKLLLDIPMQVLGLFVVPIGLKTGFTGILWPWGNNDHPDNGGLFWKTKCGDSWWCAYQWFALRNPTNNLSHWLGFKSEGKAIFIDGTSRKIGDTKAEGWYYLCERLAWEVYYIKAYSVFGQRKCLRVRVGWKINNADNGELCPFCFVISPFHEYSGA